MTLELGIVAPYANGVITSGALFKEFVTIAEECGVESLWTVEHVIEAEVYEKPTRIPKTERCRVGSCPWPIHWSSWRLLRRPAPR
jgi:hypothetical protein